MGVGVAMGQKNACMGLFLVAIGCPGKGTRPPEPSPRPPPTVGTSEASVVPTPTPDERPPEPKPEPPSALERSAAVLAAHPDLTLRHHPSDGYAHALTIAGTEGASTLCVTSSAADWQRCFAGRWPTDGSVQVERSPDSGEICIAERSPDRTFAWSFDANDGPLRRGCKSNPRYRPARGDRPKPADPVVDVEALAGIEVVPLGPGTAVLREVEDERKLAKEALCWRSGQGLACEEPRAGDARIIVGTEYGSMRAHDSTGWVSIVRFRTAEGGSEQAHGDESLLLYRYEHGRLRLHGVLPLGGYDAERFGDNYEDGFVWNTIVVSSEATLQPSGCIHVKTSAELEVSVRVRGRAPKRSRPALERAPAHLDGRDHENSYEALVEADFSGTWSPNPAGGFDRVADPP